MVVCKYYLQGRCFYGDQCRNEHSSYDSRQSSGFGGQQKSVSFAGNAGGSSSAVNYATIKRALDEEIRLTQSGKQWPFSCLCPLKESGNIPGYDDISPEELRYEAYEAQKQNSFDAYKLRIELLKKDFDEKNAKLINMDIKSFENLCTSGNSVVITSAPSSTPFQAGGNVFSSNITSTSSPKPFGQSLFGQSAAPQGNIFATSATASTPTSGLFASAAAAAAQPLFGQSTPVFGQQTSSFTQNSTPTNLFGQSASQPSTFVQQQQSNNIFGQSGQQQSTNLFGQTPTVFNQQQQSSNMFSQPASGSTNLFSQAAQPLPTNTNPYGQPSHLFAQQPSTAPSNIFGQTPATSDNSFGQKPIFGQQPFSQVSPAPSIFGQAATPGANVFNQTAAIPAPNSNLFGQPPAPTQVAPAPSIFGQSGGNLFGQTAPQQQPVFGQSASLFAQKPQTPSSGGSVFVQTPTPPTGLFAAAAATPPTFSQSAFGNVAAPASQGTFSQTPPPAFGVPAFGTAVTSTAGTTATQEGGNSNPFSSNVFTRAAEAPKSNPFTQTVLSNHYSEASALSPTELASFEAPSFKLGSIPVSPPTEQLCC